MAAAATGTASADAVAAATGAAEKGPALAAVAGTEPAEGPLVAAAVAGVAAGNLAVAADRPALPCGGPWVDLQQTEKQFMRNHRQGFHALQVLLHLGILKAGRCDKSDTNHHIFRNATANGHQGLPVCCMSRYSSKPLQRIDESAVRSVCE